MTNNNNNPKGRLIGLLASAKAVRQDGDTLDETARKAIVLYDLLLANANNPMVIPKEELMLYGKEKERDQIEQIEGLIRGNKLDLSRFTTWLGTFFPEVNDGGIQGLTTDHAGRILGNVEKCIKSFEEWEGDGSQSHDSNLTNN